MWSSIYMTIYICILTQYITNVSPSPLLNQSLEMLDEVNDAEIYRAVVNSISEWERKKERRLESTRIKRQDTSVCYQELGCFESSGPFGYLDMLPSTPEEISTKFLLYPVSSNRRRSGSQPAEVPFGNITDAFTWSKKGFNSSLPTKIMIHGFGSDCSHIWVYEMRSALLTVEDVNVICVDWANGATLPNYVKASANTRLVGKQLAILLKGLVDNIGLSYNKMHLIGFSLGAHVAGFAGAELGNLSRITGLDPAGPLFESQDPRARLDQSDAEFVDVIHSNGENLILGGLGSWQPMGHVDFYPNGGRMQKGCTNLFLGAVTDIIWSTAVEGRSLCNHRRAYKFFTDSIHPRCQFPAFPCNTYDDFIAGQCYPCNDARECGNMGYYADRAKGRGQLYLITRDEEPFCAHQYLIKIESSPADVPITSYGRIQVTLIGDSLLNETFILTKKEDEEMRLGDSISRIIVPHPVLLPPTNIQVLYHSYSGWLTSGLLQWKIDKITLSDSYGKSVSVCRKNLILDSGTSVILPLYPGNCNLPQTNEEQEAEDRNDDKNRTKFIPNLNEEGKNISKPRNDSLDILNIPWTNDKENALDSETESSRALNTRIFKSGDKSEIIREIVEPILKTHSMKNGRSHDPNKEKPEITEPILGPTTTRNSATTPPTAHFKVSDAPSKETVYNFYDIEKDSDWIPSVDPTLKKTEKWKREDDAKVVSSISHSKPQIKRENGFEAIVKTVQFLPQRIARMLEDAEKYARETVLPFVSTFTPRFITDFINPRPPPQQKYVPLSYEEATTNKIRTTTALRRHITTSAPTTIFTMINQSKDEGSNKITSNEVTTVKLIRKQPTENNEITTIKKIQDGNGKLVKTTTPYTHIQKIKKKSEKIVEVFPENSDHLWMNSQISVKHDGRSVRENKAESSKSIMNEKSAKRSVKKEIYIDLPVFEDDNTIKYIPLIPDQSR